MTVLTTSNTAVVWWHVAAPAPMRLDCGHLVAEGWPISKEWEDGRTMCRGGSDDCLARAYLSRPRSARSSRYDALEGETPQ